MSVETMIIMRHMPHMTTPELYRLVLECQDLIDAFLLSMKANHPSFVANYPVLESKYIAAEQLQRASIDEISRRIPYMWN